MNLSREDVQILLLELQPEIVGSVKTTTPDTLRRAASAVREIAEALEIPIVATIVPLGPEKPTVIEEMRGVEALVRSEVSPFDNDAIKKRLEGARRKTLAIGGVSTEIAIFHAALDARGAGYDVHLLTDCIGGLGDRTDAALMRRLELDGVNPSSISSFFTSLFRDMASDAGGAVMGALGKLWSWGAPPGDDEDVRALFAELEAAWRAGDAAAFGRPFGPEAVFTAFDGARMTGPDAVAKFHEGPFRAHLAKTQLRLDIQAIRALADGVKLVTSTSRIVSESDPDGQKIGRSAQTFVLARKDGKLHIEAFQNTRVG